MQCISKYSRFATHEESTMTTHPKKLVYFAKEKQVKYAVYSQELLDPNHPLHSSFIIFCGDKTPTKRQASKFLQKYPDYRFLDK